MAPPSDSPPEWPGPSIFRSPDAPELVAELAHTLRSSLTSIQLLTETLHAGADGWKQSQRRQLALLSGSAVKMSVFTSNLMELARGGDELLGMDPQPLSIAELLRVTRDTLRPLTADADLSLRVRGDITGQRLGHPMALQRILLALATAGLELTQQGELEITARGAEAVLVEFTIHAPDAVVTGESAAALEQAVARGPEGEGWSWSPVGLSIATARHLLARFGVELRVEAGAERGLRFRFDVELPPLEHARAHPGAPAAGQSPPAPGVDSGLTSTPDGRAQRSGRSSSGSPARSREADARREDGT